MTGTIRAYRAGGDGGQTACQLAMAYDDTGLISIEAGPVKIGGALYQVPSAALMLSLDPAKACTFFAMVRRHVGTGVIDIGMYQFNAGDIVDFGAAYEMLYQYARAVIPAGTALADVDIDCWATKEAAA